MKFELESANIDQQQVEKTRLIVRPQRKNGFFLGTSDYNQEIICKEIKTKPISIEEAQMVIEGDNELIVELFKPVGYGVYEAHIGAFFLKLMPGNLSTLPPQPYPIVGEFSECAPYSQKS